MIVRFRDLSIIHNNFHSCFFKNLHFLPPLFQFLVNQLVHIRLQGLGRFENAARDLRVGCHSLFREFRSTDLAIVGDRGIDVVAVRALPGRQPFVGLLPLALVDRDPVGPEDLAVDVAAREVSIGLEHVRRQAAPHHQFDDALRDVLVDQVRDAGMTEDMRGDVLPDSGPLDEAPELHAYRAVRQRGVVLGNEDRHCGCNRHKRVIALPFDQELSGHHQPDVPGLAGLEVHIYHNAVVIEPEVAPFHQADLPDAESAFVQHHHDGQVPACGAGIDDRGDLVCGEEVGGDLGHGVVGRHLEAADLLLRDWDKFIGNEPEVELLDDENMIRDGVLLERSAPDAPAVFQCCNS